MNAILLNVGVLTLSLVVLVAAAQKTVDSLISIAKIFDIPDALIAMSIIALGTSLPEIASHVIASIGIVSGQLDPEVISFTMIGANMGSSTVQQILFVGILFLAFGPRRYRSRFFADTYLPMIGSFVLVFALAADGLFSRLDGAVLLLIFLGFLVGSFVYRERTLEVDDPGNGQLGFDIAVATGGFIAIGTSAFFGLRYVEILVNQLQLNGSVVGMISIGFAAALPEFSTIVESIRRDSPYLALGTLLGSNIVNPLVGIGAGALISTYSVPDSLLMWDLPFKFVVGLLLLLWMYLIRNNYAGRREGFALVICYFLYFAVRMLVFI